MVTWCPTKNLGPIGSAVLTFIGYKQTNKQTDRQAKFIYRRVAQPQVQELNAFQQRYFSHCWSYKGLKSTFVNWTMASSVCFVLYSVSLEIKNFKNAGQQILDIVWFHLFNLCLVSSLENILWTSAASRRRRPSGSGARTETTDPDIYNKTIMKREYLQKIIFSEVKI